MFLFESVTDQLWLLIGRKSDVDDLNTGIFDQLVRCLMNGGNFPAVSNFCRLFRPPRSDRDDRKTGRGISQKLNVGHDKPCADTSDLKLSTSDAGVRFKVGRVWHGLIKNYVSAFNAAAVPVCPGGTAR